MVECFDETYQLHQRPAIFSIIVPNIVRENKIFLMIIEHFNTVIVLTKITTTAGY